MKFEFTEIFFERWLALLISFFKAVARLTHHLDLLLSIVRFCTSEAWLESRPIERSLPPEQYQSVKVDVDCK